MVILGRIFDRMGDKIVGVRVVVTYQDFTPKSGYKEAEDGSGRKAKVLKKSVRCRIEKAIRKR
ncbi:hypothetical protein C5S35_16385 [Candidatus Methanophagaceae archaeon]|nr:hypothetical protein C5S35_16385 [Methanophagales archaeon]